jgi:hypothetical protein
VLTAVVQTTVPAAVMGVATSTITFFRQLGASIWLAISGSIFSTAFREQLPTRMTANGVPDGLAVSLTSGSGAAASEASTNVGDLGSSILAALPTEAREVVEPFIAGVVTGQKEAYAYLGASIETFPHGDEMCRLIRTSGFAEATAQPLSGGIVTIYCATR